MRLPTFGFLLGVLIALPLLVISTGCGLKTTMPGKSFQGPLPAMTAEETDLAANLKRHVQKIAGDLGEHNLDHPDALEAAAKYVEAEFVKLGFEPGRQEYDVGGKAVRNIDATVAGASKPDEI